MIDSGVVAATQDTAIAWLSEDRRVVQALLVEVEGSAPLPVGAMMVIDDQGNIEGSITGGCVEGAVVTEAEELLAAGSPAPGKLLRYGISDELAGTVGLMCGGIVHILVYELSGDTAEVERAVLEAHADGRPAAVATLVDGPSAGSRLAVIDNVLIGSLRHTDLLDRNVSREAQGLLEEGKTTLRRFGADGATLGDDIRVHIRSYALPPQMWIIGAIDFSAALAPFASQIGYQVTICDARDRFARSRRFSSVASVKIGWPQEIMADVELGVRDAVLVFTHDPKFDEPALIAALNTNAGYIGALGSRQTTADREERLKRSGVGEADLARIHAPCGLDIGSRTAEETAVSVLAEIIAARAERVGSPLRQTSGPIHGHDRAEA
ncbi:MAG TPA: XdhC/CoxI family protein [Solirubrobacteraceae bacterium]|nr:XdhC/CoxI family protein [Solirubrobacteraceae bacterium]